MTAIRPNTDELAQQATLGCCMLDNTLAGKVIRSLDASDFTSPYSAMFEAVADSYGQGQPFDASSLQSSFSGIPAGLPEYCEAAVCSTATIDTHISAVQRYATGRKRREIGAKLAAGEIKGAEAEAELSALRRRQDNAAMQPIMGLAIQVANDIEAHVGVEPNLTMSGLCAIDEVSGGWAPSNLIIAAGRTSVGKSALLANVVHNLSVGDKRKPTAVFSMEMSEAEMIHRLISINSGLPLWKLRKPKHGTPDFIADMHAAARNIGSAPITIFCKPAITMTALRSMCLELKNQQPNLCLIAVDYLQLLRSDLMNKNDTRANQVQRIAYDLKALAMETQTIILALAQLNRAAEGEAPLLSHLKESGGIEEAADQVIALWRPKTAEVEQDSYYINWALLKNRQGRLGKGEILFQVVHQRMWATSTGQS